MTKRKVRLISRMFKKIRYLTTKIVQTDKEKEFEEQERLATIEDKFIFDLPTCSDSPEET